MVWSKPWRTWLIVIIWSYMVSTKHIWWNPMCLAPKRETAWLHHGLISLEEELRESNYFPRERGGVRMIRTFQLGAFLKGTRYEPKVSEVLLRSWDSSFIRGNRSISKPIFELFLGSDLLVVQHCHCCMALVLLMFGFGYGWLLFMDELIGYTSVILECSKATSLGFPVIARSLDDTVVDFRVVTPRSVSPAISNSTGNHHEILHQSLLVGPPCTSYCTRFFLVCCFIVLAAVD